MSLDVYLESDPCPYCGRKDDGFSSNITHNLGRMAAEAGIYDVLWRPDEAGIERASQVADTLRVGITEMRADPERFRRFNAANGWGTYDQFLPWLKEYLAACEANPSARVRVSR